MSAPTFDTVLLHVREAVRELCNAGLSDETARAIVRVELDYEAETSILATMHHRYLGADYRPSGRRAIEVEGVTWYFVGGSDTGEWSVWSPLKFARMSCARTDQSRNQPKETDHA